MPRYIRPLVADVVPFSYRDGDTFLEIVSQQEEAISACLDDIQTLTDAMNEYTNIAEAIPAQIKAQVDDAYARLKVLIKDLFAKLGSSTFLYDPAWGIEGPQERVMADLWNNLAVQAFMARSYDAQSWTAATFDAKGYSARGWDTCGGSGYSTQNNYTWTDLSINDRGDHILGLSNDSE